MLEENLDKYGIGQRDGTTFVFPTSEIDSLIPKGDFAAVERAFGLPDGISKISTRSALISRTRKTIT